MSNKSMSKNDVLHSISVQLRREDIPDLIWVKLLTLYARLANWSFPLTPTPSKGAGKASPLDLVLQAERKRRAEGQR